MKRWSFLILFVLMACSEVVEKPKNLVPADQMAEILADFAVNDQSYIISMTENREASTKFILRKYKISSKDFTESYTYYVANEKLESIIDKAQEALKKKEPKLEEFIKKKEQGELPQSKEN
ncbi:DUF4296 domain-containing protein [Soonwooa sp.]|uniref:DUF4296 domain-containing protein n=1 Tax=Soonwooa sp. TaxID=1938592 RepID=UPI0026267494|nr:DUF4296 domain-containing protein [Soonwooa sp.]